ncbi:tRNA pseudouridine synthase A [Pontibacter sp. JH31]|uniref:tRNA pseudouridine synthase A n=1 Tax=Pontibacter aquaedesilientis TaxID=2766980 RepID=A0ABR7XBT6_9BACT|nr:tRNA pseudouridine synthase A [Pontibacter aquaedesilientis]MBD1395750.1 tRNA pseudouridine synthase A [Pontibacter aquaedesilientis]
MRYFFHIGYSGTNYRGWQRHPYGVNVQATIEACLGKILRAPVAIVGCGRTDAGVHASQFFFHLDVAQPWEFDMLFRLNKVLPPDIAVFDIIPMEGLPHARFDANSRSYDYFIHTYKDPFLSDVSSLYLIRHLNLDHLKTATALLPFYKDFKNFCITPAAHESTLCHVTTAQWLASENGDRLRFQISANRFLSRMIRIIVGKLLQVGTGALSLDEFESYLATEHTPKILSPAFPQGLYLSKVTYPYLNLAPRSSSSGIGQPSIISGWQTV